jgi:hypothetical protein
VNLRTGELTENQASAVPDRIHSSWAIKPRFQRENRLQPSKTRVEYAQSQAMIVYNLIGRMKVNSDIEVAKVKG